MNLSTRHPDEKRVSFDWRLGISVALSLVILALTLARISSRFTAFSSWISLFWMLALASALLWLAWKIIQIESPAHWLLRLLLGAALLRLGAGVLWFVSLPAGGYETPVQQAGYVMDDAYQRDMAAWELAQSRDSLLNAFGEFRSADQYGGMLFVSALLYRYLSPQAHLPLLIVILCAAFSAASVLFTWAFTRRLWGEQAAGLSAWGIALYPEAVLLGSSQMREAITVTLAALAVYLLIRYWKGRNLRDLAGILAVLLTSVLFSPPFSGLLLATLLIFMLALDEWRVLKSKFLWLSLGAFALIAAVAIWLSWGQFAPQGISDPVSLIGWFIRKSADYQAYLSRRASGWLQKVFRSTPEWMHLPFLLVYGILRPMLPAALLAGGTPLWRAIAIWRSLGWTLLLSLLVYALVRLIQRQNWRAMPGAMFLVAWSANLIASYRGGGDLWDNPRYRAMFTGLQVSLAAWAWVDHTKHPGPWLRRVLIGVGLVIAWLTPWYLQRYYPSFEWPIVDLFKTIALGLASAVLFLIWDWAKSQR